MWILGEDLTRVVFENNIQFIWGVFSAFDKNIKIEDVLKYPLSYADGNPSFWSNNYKMQNPLAEIEIVSWDSASVLIIAKQDEVVDYFLKSFPLAEDLIEYNRKQ